MILFQYLFDEFEFSPRDGLEHKFPIAGIVKEGARLPTRAELCQGLEVGIKHVAQNVVWS